MYVYMYMYDVEFEWYWYWIWTFSFNSTNTFDLKKLRRRDASVESLNSPLCVWEEFHSSGLSSPTKQFKASAISNRDEISNNSCNQKYHLQILPQILWKLSKWCLRRGQRWSQGVRGLGTVAPPVASSSLCSATQPPPNTAVNHRQIHFSAAPSNTFLNCLQILT